MTDKIEDKPKAKADKTAPEEKAEGQLIHQVIRVISKDGSAQGGSWRLDDIEDYLMQYLMNGWKLYSTHAMGQLPEGFVFMWVLTKDA